MIIIKYIFNVIFSILVFQACSVSDSSEIIFSGNIKNCNDDVIIVSNYNNTIREEYPLDSMGNFKAKVAVEKDGYYFFKIGTPYAKIRFKKGKNVHLNLDANNFFDSRRFSGGVKIENNFNVQKSTLRAKLVGNSKDYFVVPLDEFLPKIRNTKDSVYALIERSKLSFNDKKLEKRIADYDYLQTYNNYQKFYSYHKKSKAKLPDDYYNPIIQMDLDDDEMFRHSSAYRNLIIANFRHSSSLYLRADSSLSIIEFVKNKINNIKSVYTREQFASMLLRKMKQDNVNIDQDYQDILPLFTTERMKNKLSEKYQSALATVSGKKSIEFNYENYNGGRTTLEDFAGKLVYIDVWATWCGPCIKEFPHLKKLVNEFSSKNIEFVSISIDHKKDYEKWRQMVSEKNIGGTHLFDHEGLGSSFMKAFNVGMIPRFMMLDREGKIISSNAPRPSSNNVREFIQKHLNNPALVKFSLN
tara:strand:+ start:368 stop:1777 length:1410 start_codon:yes stop_codon:yes gene_type:complete